MSMIDEELIFPQLDLKNSDEIISFLAEKLEKAGRVKPSFEQAVKDREKKFPTGLPSGEIAVAIPHTDVEHVNEASLVFATLKSPIKFQNMADKNQSLPVSFVVMLAMKEPHSQVTMLQSLMQLFQNQDHLKELLSLDGSKQFYSKVTKYLNAV